MIRKQGESILRDFTFENGTLFDANWIGQWFIFSNNVPIIGGFATLSTDNTKMQFRITMEHTQELLGDYLLVFELYDSTTGYRKEFPETLIFLDEDIDNIVDPLEIYTLDFSLSRNSQYIGIYYE